VTVRSKKKLRRGGTAVNSGGEGPPFPSDPPAKGGDQKRRQSPAVPSNGQKGLPRPWGESVNIKIEKLIRPVSKKGKREEDSDDA